MQHRGKGRNMGETNPVQRGIWALDLRGGCRGLCRRGMSALALSLALAGTGCSSDSGEENTLDVTEIQDGDQTTQDTTLPQDAQELAADLTQTDAQDQADSTPMSACLQALAEAAPFELWSAGADTQIHADVAFDGEAIWVAFNAPAPESSSFAVFVTRLGCDGSVLVEPTMVSNVEDGNQVDPDVAVSGDRVLVSWQADTGVFPNNMDTLYRVFGRDGSALTDVFGSVIPTVNGVVQEGNIWMPRSVGFGDGSFAVACSMAMTESTGFQMVIQKVTSTGLLDGEALYPQPEAALSQVYPALGLMEEGKLAVAWLSESTEADTQMLYGFLPKGAQTVESITNVRPDAPITSGDIATLPSGAGFVTYTAEVGGDSDVWLRPVDPTAKAVRSFGGVGTTDHSSALAVVEDGGVIAWYRNLGGLKNHIIAQRFAYADGMFLVTEAQKQINVDPAGPYAMAFDHVEGPYYFFAWSQGTSPAFRIFGRFVQLP